MKTTLNLQDFNYFTQLNNDVYWDYEQKYIEEFGEPKEYDRDNLNEWVGEKAKEYLNNCFEELNKDEYTEEQLEEIKNLLGI